MKSVLNILGAFMWLGAVGVFLLALIGFYAAATSATVMQEAVFILAFIASILLFGFGGMFIASSAILERLEKLHT